MTIKELLKGKLTKREMDAMPSSFELIGNRDKFVAIIEIPNSLKPKKGLIADAIMKKHRAVKAVLQKESPRFGEFRTRKYRLIKGMKDTEVIHIENGCRLMLNPQTVYFSPRESTERQRILDKIKDNESVIVFFAGVGPFAIEIAKKKKVRRVVGIEINPAAIDYFLRNIRLNKLQNVEAILGDVAEKYGTFENQFDRVIMPLPEKSSEYIREAIRCLKPGGVCNFYFFENEDKVNNWKKRIRDIAKGMKRKIRIIETKKVLPYGPRIWKYRMDFELLAEN